jgi:drug/metabolite transporter (DMT)-like permease
MHPIGRLFRALSPYRPIFLIALFCAFWSSAFSMAKIALVDCPPLLFLAARFLIAGVAMLGLAAALGQKRPSRRDTAKLALLGTINNAIYLSLSYLGLPGLSAGLAALIVSANPILTAIGATIFLRERITWRKIAGLLLGFGGVSLVVQARLSAGADSAWGVELTVTALFVLVTGTILFKLLAPKAGLWVGSGIQNLAGGLAVAPFAALLERAGDINPTFSLLVALTYVVICVSIIGLLIWFYLLTTAGATAASSYFFLTPPLGVFFGWLLLGERISAFDVLAIAPVACGIYLVSTTPSRSEVAAPSAGMAARPSQVEG